MAKIVRILLLVFLTLETGCVQPMASAEKLPKPPEIASNSTLESGGVYSSVLPYVPNRSKGVLSGHRARLDTNRLELGLLELAQKRFSVDHSLFREGQIFSPGDVKRWLSPFLLHVLEYNFLDRKTQMLSGIAIGLSISPNRGSDEKDALSVEQQRKQVEEIGQSIVEQIREKGINVPVLIAAFAVKESSSLVPGSFINFGWFPEGTKVAESWKPIEERFVLYPSRNSLSGAEEEFSRAFSHFRESIVSYFPDITSSIGLVRFLSGKPVEATITVYDANSSKTEIMALVQHMADLLKRHFPDQMQINLYVQSIDQPEAIYVRPANGTPFFHIYR